MSQSYGREVPPAHRQGVHRTTTKYLVVIDSGGVSVARLFQATREQVAEFDAGAEEVASLIKGIQAEQDADRPEWDGALRGHSGKERAEALVYTLQP